MERPLSSGADRQTQSVGQEPVHSVAHTFPSGVGTQRPISHSESNKHDSPDAFGSTITVVSVPVSLSVPVDASVPVLSVEVVSGSDEVSLSVFSVLSVAEMSVSVVSVGVTLVSSDTSGLSVPGDLVPQATRSTGRTINNR